MGDTMKTRKVYANGIKLCSGKGYGGCKLSGYKAVG